MPGKNKDKYPGQIRPWAPTPVDVAVNQVNPVPGWLVLEEVFLNLEKSIPGTDVILAIVRPYVSNTMYGSVLRIHPKTQRDYGVTVGDTVIFKEFSGGRWMLDGIKTLITPVEAILATVDNV